MNDFVFYTNTSGPASSHGDNTRQVAPDIDELVKKLSDCPDGECFDMIVMDGVSFLKIIIFIIILILKVFKAARNKYPDNITLHGEEGYNVTSEDLSTRRDILYKLCILLI